MTNSGTVADSLKESNSLALKSKILGLVAGEGKLPSILAKSAKEKGYKIVALALSEDAQARILPHADVVHLVSVGQIGRNLNLLQKENVEQMVFIGKIPKLNLLRNILKLDWLAVKELSKLANFSDDSIQGAAGQILEQHGIAVLSQAEFLRHLFPGYGVMTKRQPSASEYADIAYGYRVAKEIARLEIGQTVIVKDQMILAIEAIEGTDEAIRRAVRLAHAPVVVVKVAKLNQDQRFDIPTVGINTLNAMRAPQEGGVLAIEANETMVVDHDQMVAFADNQSIVIVAT